MRNKTDVVTRRLVDGRWSMVDGRWSMVDNDFVLLTQNINSSIQTSCG